MPADTMPRKAAKAKPDALLGKRVVPKSSVAGNGSGPTKKTKLDASGGEKVCDLCKKTSKEPEKIWGNPSYTARFWVCKDCLPTSF